MRRLTQWLMIAFAFAIPWEFSFNTGEPLGPPARILGLMLLLAAIPAVFDAKRLRRPTALHWTILGFYLWLCCSYFWSPVPDASLERLRAYSQQVMIVALVYEFADSPRDLRNL